MDPSHTASQSLPDWLTEKLRCPKCRRRLARRPTSMECVQCKAHFPTGPGYLDVLNRLEDPLADDWHRRLNECDDWYLDLASEPDRAVELLASDYRRFRDVLSLFTGEVLDLGGGNGLPRAYLPGDTRYVSLDPSEKWLADIWTPVAAHLSVLKHPPLFVRGVGEATPFADASFDAVLMFWSLNHVRSPEDVLTETFRVLKPGGSAFLVLEDMRPSLLDLLSAGFWSGGLSFGILMIRTLLKQAFPGQVWSVQSDHIAITDADMKRWIRKRFYAVRRWHGRYLTYTLRRR